MLRTSWRKLRDKPKTLINDKRDELREPTPPNYVAWREGCAEFAEPGRDAGKRERVLLHAKQRYDDASALDSTRKQTAPRFKRVAPRSDRLPLSRAAKASTALGKTEATKRLLRSGELGQLHGLQRRRNAGDGTDGQ